MIGVRNAAGSSFLQTENGVGPFVKRGGRNERDDRGKEGKGGGREGWKDVGSLTVVVEVVVVSLSPKYLLRSSDSVTFTFHHFL